MASNTKHVVIIGGSYTGTGVAHGLLKLPNVKVTLINPSSTFYFNIGAPRVLAKPSSNPADRVLVPIANAFKRYPATSFEFILGAASSIDTAAKTISLSNSSRTISYDYLVIASGSTTPGTVAAGGIPFKPTASDDLKAAITRAQDTIAAAGSIVIAGGGPVGVETAGEIAESYPKTSITLISAGARVLTELKPSASAKAEANLRALKVTIIKSTKVVDAAPRAGGGGWDVKLSDGETLTPDLYISAVGVLPNSSFLDAKFLDADGWVQVDGALRLQGVADGSAYALGDVTTHKQRYMMKALDQIPVVVGNIKASIAGGAGAGKVDYKPNTKLMEFVPIGSKSGTGQIGDFVVFSFMVAMVKGKDYFISKAGSYIGLK